MDFASFLGSEILKKKSEFKIPLLVIEADGGSRDEELKRKRIEQDVRKETGKRLKITKDSIETDKYQDGQVKGDMSKIEENQSTLDMSKIEENQDVQVNKSKIEKNQSTLDTSKIEENQENNKEQNSSLSGNQPNSFVEEQSIKNPVAKDLPVEKQQPTNNHCVNQQTPNETVQDKLFLINPQEIVSNKQKVAIQNREYIKYILQKWESEIAEKLNKSKDENQYDLEMALLVETKKQLVPLLVQLRKQSLPENMYPSLSTIIYYLQQKDFRAANETYLKLSIGNVAWPIGIIGVGIHARSAQEKITGEKNMANIMINEKTRKWITAVKRLVTFCENHQDV